MYTPEYSKTLHLWTLQVGYTVSYNYFNCILQNTMSKVPGFQPGRINNLVKLDSPKVVDTVEIEDIGDKVTDLGRSSSKQPNLLIFRSKTID